MNPPKDNPAQRRPQKRSRSSEAAFDVFLRRGLHQIYDKVAREPVPDELLKIIEADREAHNREDGEGRDT